MAELNVSSAVQRITVLQPGSSGALAPVTIYKKRSKRKKGTFGVRNVEKVVRRVTRGNRMFLSEYLRRHNKSNRKRRNGWVRNLGNNLARSANSGRKELNLSRLFFW